MDILTKKLKMIAENACYDRNEWKLTKEQEEILIIGK